MHNVLEVILFRNVGQLVLAVDVSGGLAPKHLDEEFIVEFHWVDLCIDINLNGHLVLRFQVHPRNPLEVVLGVYIETLNFEYVLE